MAQYKLVDVASVIRSKNSGPFELTFDVIFKDFETYNKVKDANIFNEKMFCELYHIKAEDIINIIHSTLQRPSRPPSSALSHRVRWAKPMCTAHSSTHL